MSPIEPKYLEALQMLSDGEKTVHILTHRGITDNDLSRALAKIRFAYGAQNTTHLIAILLRKKIIK